MLLGGVPSIPLIYIMSLWSGTAILVVKNQILSVNNNNDNNNNFYLIWQLNELNEYIHVKHLEYRKHVSYH